MNYKIITTIGALSIAALIATACGGTSSVRLAAEIHPAAPLPPGTQKGCQELHNWLGTINPNGNYTLTAQEGNKILSDAGSSSFNSDFYNWLNSTSKSGEASAGRKIDADCKAYYLNILAATGVNPWPVSSSPPPATPSPQTPPEYQQSGAAQVIADMKAQIASGSTNIPQLAGQWADVSSDGSIPAGPYSAALDNFSNNWANVGSPVNTKLESDLSGLSTAGSNLQGDASAKQDSGTPIPSADYATFRKDAAVVAADVGIPFPKVAAPPPPPKPSTFFTDSGSGSTITPTFTVPDPFGNGGNWTLYYSYDCSGTGQAGNFIISEDEGNDTSGASVNELSLGRSGSTQVIGDGGPHNLQIISECNWTIKAVTAP